MKNVKRISVLSILLAIALVFTGCTNGELKLYNAFLKSQEIESMESESELTFKLEGENLPEEMEVMLKEVSDVLNGLKINLNEKMVQNEDKTAAKVQIDTGIDMGGIKTDLSIWMDANITEENPEINYIIKMPQMIMAMLGEDMAGKEYIAYDYNDALETSGMDINYEELMEWSKEMEPMLTNFLKENVKNFESNVKMVESKGKRVVDQEVFDIYELRLKDESFKMLLRNFGNEFMENEDMNKFMVEYMEMVFSLMESQNVENSEEMKKEIENIKGEINKELPNMKENFNEFMNMLDEITILGEEGIVMEYAINKDGYIVGEKGSINLMLDLEVLGLEGVVKLTINSNSKNFNINGDVKIEMPELNKENTINLGDLM